MVQLNLEKNRTNGQTYKRKWGLGASLNQFISKVRPQPYLLAEPWQIDQVFICACPGSTSSTKLLMFKLHRDSRLAIVQSTSHGFQLNILRECLMDYAPHKTVGRREFGCGTLFIQSHSEKIQRSTFNTLFHMRGFKTITPMPKILRMLLNIRCP